MALGLRLSEPFDHPDWIFEPKIDGFRALAHVQGHRCTLVSRNGHILKSWPQLGEEIAHSVRAHAAILDAELCYLNPDGTSDFKDLLFGREWPFFIAFDLLAVDGEDIRSLPLLRRKAALRRIMPSVDSRLHYLDHADGRGVDLFAAPANGILKGSLEPALGTLPHRRLRQQLDEDQELAVHADAGSTRAVRRTRRCR